MKFCSLCGKMFEETEHQKDSICPVCHEEEEYTFSVVQEYLLLNHGAKLIDVATNLKIPVSKIKRLLREGRVEIIEKDSNFLTCVSCGKSICSGMYCEDCKKNGSLFKSNSQSYDKSYSNSKSKSDIFYRRSY